MRRAFSKRCFEPTNSASKCCWIVCSLSATLMIFSSPHFAASLGERGFEHALAKARGETDVWHYERRRGFCKARLARVAGAVEHERQHPQAHHQVAYHCP